MKGSSSIPPVSLRSSSSNAIISMARHNRSQLQPTISAVDSNSLVPKDGLGLQIEGRPSSDNSMVLARSLSLHNSSPASDRGRCGCIYLGALPIVFTIGVTGVITLANFMEFTQDGATESLCYFIDDQNSTFTKEHFCSSINPLLNNNVILR